LKIIRLVFPAFFQEQGRVRKHNPWPDMQFDKFVLNVD